VRHKQTRVQLATGASVSSFQVTRADTGKPLTGAVPIGTMVDFSWGVDRARASAVWLVHLNPNGPVSLGNDKFDEVGDNPDGPDGPAGLLYATPANQDLPGKVTIPIRMPGTYRLYAGLVGYGEHGEDEKVESWCPDTNTKELTVTLGPEPTGTLAFDNPSPPWATLVQLRVSVTPYYGNQVSLVVDPPTPDNGRVLTLDANGDATIFIKAPPTVGVFTYRLSIDGKLSTDSATLTTHMPETLAPAALVTTMEFDDKFPDHSGQLVQLKVLVYPRSSLTKAILSVEPKTPDDGREIVLDENGDATIYIATPNFSPVPGVYQYKAYTYKLTVNGIANVAQAVLTPGPDSLAFVKPIGGSTGIPVIGVTVQGEARLVLRKDGTYTFRGYLKAGGPFSDANVRILVDVFDSPGLFGLSNRYRFGQIVHLSSSVLSSGSAEYVWNDNGQDLEIAHNWGNLLRGATDKWTVDLTSDLGAWLGAFPPSL